MDKFKKYLKLLSTFLNKSSDIHDIMLEMQACQNIQSDILIDKFELKKELQKVKRDYDFFLAEKMDSVSQQAKKQGKSIKSYQELQNRTIRLFRKEIEEKRDKLDNAENEYEIIQNIYFIVLQRKDILVSVVKYWTNAQERESCLMANKDFITKVMERIDV